MRRVTVAEGNGFFSFGNFNESNIQMIFSIPNFYFNGNFDETTL